ncbi:RNA-binding protein [Bacillus sp. FJAT-49711]|uniref:YlmH family RNA-binding protein n=1 Tax=Bacillus sp. FJAT-49711 TaxID=2833585 RepID=UPI001BCA5A90|nr:RNA-binding protein [Bacillus sp. FJAT-49711]MBS4217822.1 RNA-binding protein [Bacillus sp. FJAT-49711]
MSVIYQHFRPEEKEFIDQVVSMQQYVENTYAEKLTDFLDPRQQYILKSIIGENNEVKYLFFGGTENSERKRALIFPDYLHPNSENFFITLFEVDYPKKFVKLDHRMVLGTLMSLGLKREKFGDININGDRIQFFIANEVENFVIHQLNSIGKAKVSIIKQDLQNAIKSEESWKEKETTASSLRLDVILAASFNISRQKAQGLIQQGHTKVNWETVERTAFECGEGDVLSARGYGRCSLLSIQGKTKKDKLRLKIGLLN